MKHIFIINPKAGEGGTQKVLEEKISDLSFPIEHQIYQTTASGDATVFVKKYLAAHPDEEVRFYACGGDGTANEVANGLAYTENEKASMTVYACGSGNDYIKYYGSKEDFLDLPALIAGKETAIDLMKVGERYAINVTNFGFDTKVAKVGNALKSKFGSTAYTIGVVVALFTQMATKCTVTIDDQEVICPKKLLLCSVANGRYVGGQYKCAPKGRNDDGLLEVCVVKIISHFKFVSLLGPYTKGKHLDLPKFNNILVYRQAKKVHVKATPKFQFSLDGEIIGSEEFDIEIAPAAVRFAVPAKCVK